MAATTRYSALDVMRSEDQCTERALRGARGLLPRLEATGLPYRQEGRLIRVAPRTLGTWTRRGCDPHYPMAEALRSLLDAVDGGDVRPRDLPDLEDRAYAEVLDPLPDAVGRLRSSGFPVMQICGQARVDRRLLSRMHLGGSAGCFVARRLLRYSRLADEGAVSPGPPDAVSPKPPGPPSRSKPLAFATVAPMRARHSGCHEPERISFVPEVHTGIIERMARTGLSRGAIACALGVAPSTLRNWLLRYPELSFARLELLLFSERLSELVHALALGPYDPETDSYLGGDASLLLYLLRDRYGWPSRAGRPRGSETPPLWKNRRARQASAPSPSDVDSVLDRILRKLEAFDDGDPAD